LDNACLSLLICGGRWKAHEDALVKAEEENAKSLSSEEAKAKKLQIFDPNEAFLMISNELAGIIRQQDANFYADSVGDDVYTWDVWMGNFKQSSPLSKVRHRRLSVRSTRCDSGLEWSLLQMMLSDSCPC
jgi:hypothetical protein